MIQASWLDPMSPGGSRISPASSPLLGSHRQASAIPAFKTELQERCWESYAPRSSGRECLPPAVAEMAWLQPRPPTVLSLVRQLHKPQAPHSVGRGPSPRHKHTYQHLLDTALRTIRPSFRTSFPQIHVNTTARCPSTSHENNPDQRV